MDIHIYNELQILYVTLTEKFSRIKNYTFDGFYKCFDKECNFVKESKTGILTKLSNYTINDIFSDLGIKEIEFSEEYLNRKIVKIYDDKICIDEYLGFIIYYFILDNLKNEINEFCVDLEKIINKPTTFISVNNQVITFDVLFFENWIDKYRENKKMQMLLHLFSKTNSNIIVKNFYGQIEINEFEILEINEYLSYFDFNKLYDEIH